MVEFSEERRQETRRKLMERREHSLDNGNGAGEEMSDEWLRELIHSIRDRLNRLEQRMDEETRRTDSARRAVWFVLGAVGLAGWVLAFVGFDSVLAFLRSP